MDIKKVLYDSAKRILTVVIFILITEIVLSFFINLTVINFVWGYLIWIVLSYPMAILSLSFSFYAIFRDNWRKKINTVNILAALIVQPLIMYSLLSFNSQYLYIGKLNLNTYNIILASLLSFNSLIGILETQYFPPFFLTKFIYRGFDGVANRYYGTATEEEFLSLATVLNKENEKAKIFENGGQACYCFPVKNFLRRRYVPLVYIFFDKSSGRLRMYTMKYSGFHAISHGLDYLEILFRRLNLTKEESEKFSKEPFNIDKQYPKFIKSYPLILGFFLLNIVTLYFARNYVVTTKLLPETFLSTLLNVNNFVRDYPLISLVIALIIGFILRDIPRISEICNSIKNVFREA